MVESGLMSRLPRSGRRTDAESGALRRSYCAYSAEASVATGTPARQEDVERPEAGPAQDQRQRDTEREEVELEALALLGAVPVHEEAMLRVAREHRNDHHARDPEGRHPRQE